MRKRIPALDVGPKKAYSYEYEYDYALEQSLHNCSRIPPKTFQAAKLSAAWKVLKYDLIKGV
ncbi:MAG: hypothetical protein Q8882_09250 [Bacillota bacterium]|nr:hypothetical protein [Bacillota bacterium]